MNVPDEKALWRRCKEQGDDSAREQLVLYYVRIVKYIAGRMAIHVPTNVEMNDLVGWGMLGLLDAIDKFDHRQDIKFTTYASIRVRGAIIDEIRSLDWAPRSLRTMARKVGSAKEKLRHEKGREPSYEDIAVELGVCEDVVEDTLMQVQTAHILSLDDYLPSEENGETRKVEVTPGGSAVSPEQVALDQERQEGLVAAIFQLPDQMQKVLNLYYYQELTLKEIGLVLEVSESRVCQIHSAAMKQLRKVMQGGA
ncbi:MAG: FliA/WhiG family RNA polymerase sigma factor [Candidatus Hydrogenedentes bacterium]|nr:FliA/WhiG family RNA polymerase sigma factor [Candidatus Hydrogenedentota bacterium]